MLTRLQIEEFERLGILRIEGAISAAAAEAMCACVWDNLGRRFAMRRDRPESWKTKRVMGTNAIDKSVTFDQIGSARVSEILDTALGRGNWQRPKQWGSLLVTFPESRKRWDVPRASWHLDFPVSGTLTGLFVARLFSCLAPLAAGGGGTVMLAGSHLLAGRLVHGKPERLRSADVRNLLIRENPWVKALCSHDESIDRIERFMERGTTADGVELRVVEMTGNPGDVYLVHPLMLHAPALNCARVPRIVLSTYVYRNDVAPEMIYVPQ